MPPDLADARCVLVDCDRVPGEPPSPVAATVVGPRDRSVRRLGAAELRPGAPPAALAGDGVVVTYDASAALGCFLKMGWPLPASVIDLQAEFRCLTSGFEPPEAPAGHELADALAHYSV